MHSPGRRRARTRGLAALIGSVALLAGCAVGPDTGPNIVRGDGARQDNSGVPTLPELQVPKNELNWKPCVDTIVEKYGVKDASGIDLKGIELDCARYDVPVNTTEQSGASIRIGVVRARTEKTPKTAVPLVLTSGNDMPSSRTLLSFTGDQGRPLLDRRPIVAVDHRGTGTSGLIDCLTKRQRSAYDVNGAAPGRDLPVRVEKLSESARSAADQCNDALSPDQLDYSAAAAAADLEQLRTRWDVERLAVLSVGSGSSVALSFAAQHPDRLGRLIMDSPVGYNVTAKEAAASRARGLQSTIETFIRRCAGAGCALGANGAAVVGRLMSAGATASGATASGGPGSGGALSDTEVLQAVTTALAVGDTSPDGLKALGSALADADRGDTAALQRLAEQGRSIRLTDGQIVSRCNDMRGRPGGDEIPGLAQEWNGQSPFTGTTTALDLARCDGWGVADTPAAPDRFAAAPLLLIGKNDPINGVDAATNLAPLLLAAGTAQTSVSWDGLGYSVAAHSTCAGEVIGEYLDETPLGSPAERACPA